jgi:hypothetical protein
MKIKIAVAITGAVVFLASAVPAFAAPSPPTNAGNGGGQSGQCTGPAAERPAVCPGS